MKKLKSKDLFNLAFKILTAAHVDIDAAKILSEHLVESELAGHSSHGIVRLIQYLSEIREGNIVSNVQPVIVKNGSFINIDGQWGIGQVTASIAVQKATELASETGIAIVTVNNCNHIGRLEFYTRRIAKYNQVGFICVNGHGRSARVAAWQGHTPLLHTNPLSIAIPTRSEPIVLDMSTSATSEGKVRLHYINNLPIPEGWLVDFQGKPTTDAGVLYSNPRGAILPLGGIAGYKGFGLSFMIDVLAGILSGAGTTDPLKSQGHRGNGVFLCAIDVAHIAKFDDYLIELEDFIDRLHTIANSSGQTNLALPGEKSMKIRNQKLKEGIEISDINWRHLSEEARLWNIEL